MRVAILITTGFIMASQADVRRMVEQLLYLQGTQALLRGQNGELLIAPDHNSGRPMILPSGLPPPYFEPSEYPHPGYPEGEPSRQKRTPPVPRRNDEPIG